MDTVQFVESRARILLYLAGALAFVAAYVLLPDPNHRLPVWGGWFFGLCALVFLALLLRSRTLTLNGEEFSVSGGLARRTVTTAWEDVTGFFPIRIRLGTNMVGFEYSPNGPNRPKGAWLANSLSGADGGISGAWPCSTTDQLNSYRERALKLKR
jgi:hypothetical protein